MLLLQLADSEMEADGSEVEAEAAWHAGLLRLPREASLGSPRSVQSHKWAVEAGSSTGAATASSEIGSMGTRAPEAELGTGDGIDLDCDFYCDFCCDFALANDVIQLCSSVFFCTSSTSTQ